jgi:hypothetical protein
MSRDIKYIGMEKLRTREICRVDWPQCCNGWMPHCTTHPEQYGRYPQGFVI